MESTVSSLRQVTVLNGQSKKVNLTKNSYCHRDKTRLQRTWIAPKTFQPNYPDRLWLHKAIAIVVFG
jgi:hypothetical protein